MSEPAHIVLLEPRGGASLDLGGQLADLRLAGADHHDPVTCHYLQVLLERAAGQQGEVRRLLDARLMQALQALRERVEQAQREATPATARQGKTVPQALLGELVHHLAQLVPGQLGASPGGVGLSAAGSRPELKSVRHFRNTWSKLSVNKQVAKALGQAPKNAGPINSHRLVLDSLALMRDISPDYLNRFMCYADALLCLEQSDQRRQTQAKKSPRGKSAKI
ncbi:MAG: DUF2894 domain-containing protein [Polaromonas sp.]|nr:DUF2894 domain-containing protein [Polaromonas sp.]